MNRYDERLKKIEQRHAVEADTPGLMIHNNGGVYSLELDGETWPSIEALHAANPGHDQNSNTIITWV